MNIGNISSEKFFVSWSGGKDSYLSLLFACDMGLNVECLLTFTDEDGQSRSHGISIDILRRQAEALGLRLETEKVTWKKYEEGFIRATDRFKSQGITGGVFGDINLQDHRDWIEKICERCNITYQLPLWGMSERKLFEKLLDRGGKAVIVSVCNERIQEDWLGSYLNKSFLRFCESKGLSPCGERGEYHTLVVDGPFFSKPLKCHFGRINQKGKRSYLECKSY